MANVLHRATKEYRRSVNTPDYPVQDWIINPDMSAVVGLSDDEWVIDGDAARPLNATEKASLLPGKKERLIREIAGAASEYGKSKFPVEHELKLKMLYMDATSTGKTNRAAYIGQALAFEQLIVQDMEARLVAVRAAQAWDDLAAISKDFSNLDNQVPDVIVATALEITD